jgi:hypothetical protein
VAGDSAAAGLEGATSDADTNDVGGVGPATVRGAPQPAQKLASGIACRPQRRQNWGAGGTMERDHHLIRDSRSERIAGAIMVVAGG